MGFREVRFFPRGLGMGTGRKRPMNESCHPSLHGCLGHSEVPLDLVGLISESVGLIQNTFFSSCSIMASLLPSIR